MTLKISVWMNEIAEVVQLTDECPSHNVVLNTSENQSNQLSIH